MARIDPGGIQANASRMAANGEHAAEKPEAPSGREGWPRQSGWNPRNLPGRWAAAHSRHQRPLFHRMYRENVEELYDMSSRGPE